ncbi:MAG: hypothetical protein ABIK28_03650 [Planctomycetota bacterium]
MSPPFASSFSLPDAATNPGGTCQSVWCDLFIPKEALPGAYTGTLSLECNELPSPVGIDMEVIVYPAVLPDSPTFFVDLNGYGNKWSNLPLTGLSALS